MFKRIVVAYDGSDPSRSAAQVAFRIADRAKAHVLLVRVIERTDGLPAHPEAFADLQRQLRERDKEARDELQALERSAPAGLAVESKLVQGKTVGALLDLLAEEDADLALAGTHGVGGLKPYLGSVSHQLVEHAPCPVLLLRGEPPPERDLDVLAALDGSEPSLRALAAARTLAVALGASLRLVHAVDPRPPLGGRHFPTVTKMLREQGQDLLREARKTIDAPPPEEVSEEVLEGAPRTALLAACERHAPAVLVVATRGVGGFAGMLLGSTAREAINRAQCPVLVAKD